MKQMSCLILFALVGAQSVYGQVITADDSGYLLWQNTTNVYPYFLFQEYGEARAVVFLQNTTDFPVTEVESCNETLCLHHGRIKESTAADAVSAYAVLPCNYSDVATNVSLLNVVHNKMPIYVSVHMATI